MSKYYIDLDNFDRPCDHCCKNKNCDIRYDCSDLDAYYTVKAMLSFGWLKKEEESEYETN